MSGGRRSGEIRAGVVGCDHRAVSWAADGGWFVDASAEIVDARGLESGTAWRRAVSAAARSPAFGTGWRVPGAAGELGVDFAASGTVASGAVGGAPKVLNLFAYTGGSTLAAAAAGAEVVHIDAAQTIVDRAKENAAFSGLAERPVRWIAEDAVKFCRRELKRGNQYEAVILDPPSYGHGPKGEPWKIDTDLLPLLSMCGELTADSRSFVLVSCHSPGIGPAELAAYLAEGIFGNCSQPPDAGELALETADGRTLPAGVFARWPA